MLILIRGFFQVGSLSLLSSAAASDDQSDLNDSETGESTPPLFLQVSVNECTSQWAIKDNFMHLLLLLIFKIFINCLIIVN